MRVGQKDSPEVIEFMVLFARLKDWIDDEPNNLRNLYKEDESVMELCVRLSLAAGFLRMNERRYRELFSAPVDSKFRNEWRDYEKRYEPMLCGVWNSDLLEQDGIDTDRTPSASLQWQYADDQAEEQKRLIGKAIDFASVQIDQSRADFPEKYVDKIEEGIVAWETLKDDIISDLRGVLRRRDLVPFVLVPRHIAAKYGDTDKLSMLKNLRQAHDAFVFGAPYAALALMRSIMEAALREHYSAEGRDLEAYIRHVHLQLPAGANEAALHRLRKLANAVLHIKREKDEGLSDIDDTKLEREIVSLLFVIRALIEGSPDQRPRVGPR